jgi:hypothetical protein
VNFERPEDVDGIDSGVCDEMEDVTTRQPSSVPIALNALNIPNHGVVFNSSKDEIMRQQLTLLICTLQAAARYGFFLFCDVINFNINYLDNQ